VAAEAMAARIINERRATRLPPDALLLLRAEDGERDALSSGALESNKHCLYFSLKMT